MKLYLIGALFFAFAGLAGLALDHEYAAEVAIAIAALLVSAFEVSIYLDNR